MTYWKINCMEDDYPGLWQTWFVQQTAAIGWPARWFSLTKPSDNLAWRMARKAATQVLPNDKIIVQLSKSRIGRIGTVVEVLIADDEWNPTVPVDKENPFGEMGRRINVRWDLSTGPISPSAVASLPDDIRFQGATLRLTMARVEDTLALRIEDALKDESNWTSVHPRFASERAISEYVAEFPHLLEAGLRPYPTTKTREFTFKDKKRSDVLLLDREDRLVVVECKQNSPSTDDLAQLRHYMKVARKEILGGKVDREVRGILVHGGPRRVHPKLLDNANLQPQIEIVRFSVDVDFASSR